MKKIFAKRRASALIITLLLISVVASISFGVTALAISEFRKATNLQDSIAAYYAAESGLEQGLMQYRIWHDAEVSKDVYDAATIGQPVAEAKVPTSTVGEGQAFNLDDPGNPAIRKPGFLADGDPKGKNWYKLKMWYRGPAIGATDANGDPVVDANLSPRISRDSALDIPLNGASEVQVQWRPVGEVSNLKEYDAPLPVGTKYFIETILSSDTPGCPIVRKVGPNLGNYFRQATLTGTMTLSDYNNTCIYTNLRIKPWGMSAMQYSLVLRDINGTPLTVDNQTSNIQATGYSGKAKRTLQVGLNRTTGTILESEDFLLLSGSTTIIY